MTLREAWQHALKGRAISRKAWGDRDKFVSFAELERPHDPQGLSIGPALTLATLDLSQADLEANDWFVVESANEAQER